jgi:hypothetical protein
MFFLNELCYFLLLDAVAFWPPCFSGIANNIVGCLWDHPGRVLLKILTSSESLRFSFLFLELCTYLDWSFLRQFHSMGFEPVIVGKKYTLPTLRGRHMYICRPTDFISQIEKTCPTSRLCNLTKHLINARWKSVEIYFATL